MKCEIPTGQVLPTQQPTGMVADSKQKVDFLIRDMWSKGTNCISDMRVVNTDAASYMQNMPEKIVLTTDREKNLSNSMLDFSNAEIFPLL